jgi:hypothetical protein
MLGKSNQDASAVLPQKSDANPAKVIYPCALKLPESRMADVERFNQFSFYEIGARIGRLKRRYEPINARDAFHLMTDARAALSSLLVGDPLPINISKQCINRLLDAMKSITKSEFTEMGEDGDRTVFKFPDETDTIDAYTWSKIKTAVEHFETVFAEEMREAATYYVPRRGIFYTPALVDSAVETFPAEILGHIPQKTRDDWNAAGRCLAFNLLSASGFHVTRAVEGILESYYQIFTAQPGKTLRGWYDYHQELSAVALAGGSPYPSQKTLSELDQMRTDYRNPIAHPRVVLSESDARMLFANGESLIIAMAQEIKEARSGIQAALSLVPATGASGIVASGPPS